MFRLICAIMVVSIHTRPFSEINSSLGYFFENIFPLIGVPFFFAIAGYYYLGSLMSGKKVFIKYTKKLLIVYSLWSAIYFLILFFQLVVFGNYSIVTYIYQRIISYFILGSYYHFWFFPALFFSIITATVCYKMKLLKVLAYASIPLYIIGCLGCSYYAMGAQIPGISSLINLSVFTIVRRVLFSGLPFFMIGYFLHAVKPKLDKLGNKKLYFAIGLTLILMLLEIFFIIKLGLQKNIIVTIFLYILLFLVIAFLINNPLSEMSSVGRKTRIISNFMYYSHPLFLQIIRFLMHPLKMPKYGTACFFLTVGATIVVGLIIEKVNNKWLNKLV
ncbi:MAG: acyltransferase family protein [Bacillota bacterium]|nr:acyltransferase family protein [Bacillota bacterium]